MIISINRVKRGLYACKAPYSFCVSWEARAVLAFLCGASLNRLEKCVSVNVSVNVISRDIRKKIHS